MKVVILGAGISGLLAAKALKDKGIEYTIYDRDPQQGASNNRGLHYLHDSCGLDLEPDIVQNYVIGCKQGKRPHEQYSEKIQTPLNNSLVDLPAFSVVYNFHQAYDILKETVGEGHIHKLNFEPFMLGGFLDNYDLVISTIPLNLLYPQAECKCVEVEAVRGRPVGMVDLPGENQVVYNLENNNTWYRYSKVFGIEWTEVICGGKFKLKKVVDANFEPPDERVILLGRWGKWDRKFLAHQAYYETLRRVKEYGF